MLVRCACVQSYQVIYVIVPLLYRAIIVIGFMLLRELGYIIIGNRRSGGYL